MKNIFMSAIALSIVLISCQKQGVTPQTEIVSTQTEAVSTQTEEIKESTLGKGGDRHFFDGGGGDLKSFCWMTGNCLPTFIVWGIHQPVLGDVVAIIESEIASDIVESFIENREVLIVYIDAAYVDGVINGDYTVESEHGEENAEYVQFKNREGELVVVYPLVVNE